MIRIYRLTFCPLALRSCRFHFATGRCLAELEAAVRKTEAEVDFLGVSSLMIRCDLTLPLPAMKCRLREREIFNDMFCAPSHCGKQRTRSNCTKSRPTSC